MALLLNANDSVSRSYSITKPSPLHPIYPSECGERTGNLFNYNAYFDSVFTPYNEFFNYAELQLQPNTTYALSTSIEEVGRNPRNTAFIVGTSNETPTTTSGGISNVSPITKTTESDGILKLYKRILGNGVMPTKDLFDAGDWLMLNKGSTPLPYELYGYKLPLTSNSTPVDIYIGDDTLSAEEYVDSTTGKIYRRTKNLSPPEEEWIDGQIGGGDGTVHPSTQIKVSPFIDVSTCETCIMEVFSTENEWAAAGYREMAFYDENKQYLGWIGGGGRQTLTPDSTERLSEFPAGTVYVRIGCSHGDQPFYPQLVSGYTPTHQFYPYLVPTDPPAPFPQIPTAAGSTTISWAGSGLAPSEFDSIQEWVDIPTYKRVNGEWVEDN